MIYNIIKFKKSLKIKKIIEKSLSCKIDYLICYVVFILVIIFTIFKALNIILM